jgi:hypothetical protein
VFRTLRRAFSSRPAARAPRHSSRLAVEALEDRRLLAAAPLVSSSIILGHPGGLDPVGHSPAAAYAVPVAPMSQTSVTDMAWNARTTDYYAVSLTKGEILEINDTSLARVPIVVPFLGTISRQVPVSAQLTLTNAFGTVLEQVTQNGSQTTAYQATQNGTYYVSLTGVALPAGASGFESILNLENISLNNSRIDPQSLSQAGGTLVAWMDGKVLDIAGTTGHGFGLQGNWKKSATPNGVSYTASGTVILKSALGNISVAAPSPVTITVKDLDPSGLYGDVDQSSLTMSLVPLSKAFGSGSAFGFTVNGQMTQLQFGIKLGKDLGNTGAPVYSNIPYLYATAGDNMAVSFGGVKLSMPGSNVSFSIVADPTDPYLFVGAQNIPIGPVSEFAFAGSVKGLIPFTPAATPSHYTGQLSGNLYFDGGLDLTDLAGIPITIQGNVVIALDPAHTGKVLGGAFDNASEFVADMNKPFSSLAGDVAHHLTTALHNISAGINGKADLNLSKFGFNLDVPLAKGTVIYDGPHDQFDARAALATDDIFKGTPLQNVIKMPQASLDAYLDWSHPSAWKFDVKVQGEIVTPLASGSATLEVQNSGATLSADLKWHYDIVVAHGDIDASLSVSIGFSGAVISISGSATATLDLYLPENGNPFGPWAWTQVADIGAAINGDHFTFHLAFLAWSADLSFTLPF